jgi:hypothetical protein
MQSVRKQMIEPKRQLNSSYNLRRYQDTEDRPEITSRAGSSERDWISGLEAPYLLIGLVKDEDERYVQKSKGVFKLNEPETGFSSFIIGETLPIGVIAKSEVYYTRPSDLSYFARSDNREEKSNAFNPYWQARLVDTSYIDRVSAHAFQHGQLTLPDEASAVIEKAKSLLNAMFNNNL